MPRFLNASGRTVAQPNGEDWPSGVILSRWSEAQLRSLLAYGHVLPLPFGRPDPPPAAPKPRPEPGEGGGDAEAAETKAAPKRRARSTKEPR